MRLLEPGIVTLEVTDANGCANDDQVFTSEIAHTALTSFSLHPNPTNGHVTISGLLGKWSIVVQDQVGRTVSEHAGVSTTTRLDLAHLPAGTYAVKVSIDGMSMSKQVVLIH